MYPRVNWMNKMSSDTRDSYSSITRRHVLIHRLEREGTETMPCVSQTYDVRCYEIPRREKSTETDAEWRQEPEGGSTENCLRALDLTLPTKILWN